MNVTIADMIRDIRKHGVCPFCLRAELRSKAMEAGRVVLLECRSCKTEWDAR